MAVLCEIGLMEIYERQADCVIRAYVFLAGLLCVCI